MASTIRHGTPSPRYCPIEVSAVRYEYKKLFSSKLMWAVLVLALGYMVFIPLREIWGNVKNTRAKSRAYELAVEDAAERDLTVEELRQQRTELEQLMWGGGSGFDIEPEGYSPRYGEYAFDDLIALGAAADLRARVDYGFERDRRELVKGMVYQNLLERRKSSPDSYLIRANEKAIALYNRRTDLQFKSTGTEEHIRYSSFNYSMWEYVMLALCVLMTVRLFTLEYTTGAERLVNTSRRTVRSLFFKKLLAVWSAAAAVLVVQAIFELCFCRAVFGLKNLSLPLQQLEMFSLCPYRLTIGEFYLLKLGLRLLAYTAVISATALITLLVRRPLIASISALAVSAGGLVANMVLYVRINNSETPRTALYPAYNRLRTLLPQSLLNIKEYIRGFDCFSLFGQPVSRLGACVALAAALSGVCVALGYWLSGRIRRKG